MGPGHRRTTLARVVPSITTALPYRIGRLMTLIIPLQVRRTVHVAQDPGVRSRQQDEPLRMGGDEVAGPVVAVEDLERGLTIIGTIMESFP